MAVMSTRTLVDALRDEAFELPANCREVRLVMGYDAAFVLQYECFVSGDDLAKLGRALANIGADAPRPTGAWGHHG